jgi:ethanolamine utilization protein EutP (predicted NTPase)
LGERVEVVVITKSDIPDAELIRAKFAEKLNQEILLISAATGQGIKQLTEYIYEKIVNNKK